MQWDLGLQGLGALAVMSLAFGLIAQLAARQSDDRLGVADRGGRLLRRRDLHQRGLVRMGDGGGAQPKIDGLSFDEVLLALRARRPGLARDPVRDPT